MVNHIRERFGVFSALVRRHLVEKYGLVLLFSLFLLFPDSSVKFVGVFFMFVFTTLSDLSTGKFEQLLYLPVSKAQLYWLEFGFLVFVSSLATFATFPLYESVFEAFSSLLAVLIFAAATFGVTMLLTSFGIHPVGAAFAYVVVDSLLRGFFPTGNLRYTDVSPFTQGNTLYSLFFASALLVSGFFVFKKRVVLLGE